MTNAATCPDRQAIERLLRGLSTEDETGRLEQHLLECARCCQATAEMEVSDTLLDAVREVAAADDLPDDEQVREVMERLKDLRPPASPAESETLASSGASTEDAWGLQQLLDPPQAEGELGRFAGYRVLRVLGAGGMGLVLEAEDPQLRRRVALKVMKRPAAAGDEHHQRFLREARAAAAIEHAHIVTVYQVGEHRGLPFLAMQLLKGESLQDRLEREGSGTQRVPGVQGSDEGKGNRAEGTENPKSKIQNPKSTPSLAECLRIGRETAEALAEAHQRGLIHRDIKPGNIWLEAPRGWVKLVDFGLAHAAEDVHLTQTGAILGTPAYMSPEQARGEGVDARTDLYSLGAVLYRLTTGDVPFRGANTMAVLMALATETPKPPREINPDVPPALSDLIVRLLAKKPDDRFDSAEAVAEAIGEIEAEIVERNSFRAETVGSAGAHERNEFRSTNRRWPLVAAAAAFFLLAAIVVIVRDKDGNEVARINVPEGGSVGVSSNEDVASDKTSGMRKLPGSTDATSSLAPTSDVHHREANASRSPRAADAADSPPRSAGATLPEPPPLEEWLKGREILTVAQDGSGQFKTIQAALDALKPHQVVKVLDRGPYRERLQRSLVPADSGLISEQQTVLELSEWEKNGNGGHVFFDLQGFRLSGFVLAFPEDKEGGWGIYAQPPNGLVVENCLIRAPANCHFSAVVASWISDDGPTQPLVVRDCLFEGPLHIYSENKHAVALVERCFFTGSPVDHHISGHGALRTLVVRHNVFAGHPGNASVIVLLGETNLWEISHNTLLPESPMLFYIGAVWPVRVCNNLRTAPGLAILREPSATLGAEVLTAWDVARNCYPRQLEQGELGLAKRDILPTAATDLIAAPQFLSTDPTSRDYLRISADSPAAKITDENGRADYAGALPPGPAPKEGDWFTRLQDRWRATWTPRTIAQWVMDRGGRIQFTLGTDLAKAEDAPADGKRFWVYFDGVKDFGDDDVAVMTQWHLYECEPNPMGTAMTDVGLRRLAALKLRAGLNAWGCPITGEGFDAFKGRTIGTIVLNECKLTEAGWHRLSETGEIDMAFLANTDMSDADLAIYLAGHPETDKLGLPGNPLTDKAVELLIRRKQWDWLDLSETAIADASVPLLVKLEQVKSLNISRTKVTAAGVAALRKALPDCKIE